MWRLATGGEGGSGVVAVPIGRLCPTPSRARVQRNADGVDTNERAGSSLVRIRKTDNSATNAMEQTPPASAVKKNKSEGRGPRDNNAGKKKRQKQTSNAGPSSLSVVPAERGLTKRSAWPKARKEAPPTKQHDTKQDHGRWAPLEAFCHYA